MSCERIIRKCKVTFGVGYPLKAGFAEVLPVIPSISTLLPSSQCQFLQAQVVSAFFMYASAVAANIRQ